MSNEVKEERKDMGRQKFLLKNLVSYLGAFLIAILIISVVTIKDRYDRGLMFQGFRKKQVVENTENVAVTKEVVKKVRLKTVDTNAVALDTLALNDSTITTDTVALSAKQIEEELSDILNTAITIAPPGTSASSDSSGANQ